MPRPPRADEAGGIYHALNRGNARQTIFHDDADFEAFERIVAEALKRYPVELFAYQWLPNHWHMVLRSLEDDAMSRMLQWATMTHSARRHAHRGTAGEGHLYQGRFKSFPIQDDDHFHVVCRYVERNALAAGLVQHRRTGAGAAFGIGAAGSPRYNSPLGRSRVCEDGWNVSIERLSEQEVEKLRRCIRRGSPFGDDRWVESAARRLHLETTLRPRGRPKRFS